MSSSNFRAVRSDAVSSAATPSLKAAAIVQGAAAAAEAITKSVVREKRGWFPLPDLLPSPMPARPERVAGRANHGSRCSGRAPVELSRGDRGRLTLAKSVNVHTGPEFSS